MCVYFIIYCSYFHENGYVLKSEFIDFSSLWSFALFSFSMFYFWVSYNNLPQGLGKCQDLPIFLINDTLRFWFIYNNKEPLTSYNHLCPLQFKSKYIFFKLSFLILNNLKIMLTNHIVYMIRIYIYILKVK